MFTLDSEQALLTAFRPRDRKVVEVPKDLKFPLFVRNYLAWTHPAGGRVFLVFSVPGGVATGIAFDTNGGGSPAAPAMCDWCHSSGAGTEMGLLAAELNSRKKIGVHLCTDLSCQQRLEDEANRSGRSVVPLMQKLLERMGRFASEGLKIDLTGAGR